MKLEDRTGAKLQKKKKKGKKKKGKKKKQGGKTTDKQRNGRTKVRLQNFWWDYLGLFPKWRSLCPC